MYLCLLKNMKKESCAMIDYNTFIENKRAMMPPSGFSINTDELHDSLFDFQKDIVRWALRRGKAAIFAGTGPDADRVGNECTQANWR